MKYLMLLCMLCATLRAMDPYSFPEKTDFPEHNNFFMPHTNDLSYVPRNIGQIAIENTVKQIITANEISHTQQYEKAVVDAVKDDGQPRISHQPQHPGEQASYHLNALYEDPQLANTKLTLTLKEMSLTQIATLLSNRSGLTILVDPSAKKAIIQPLQVKEMPIGKILKIICTHAEPNLALMKDDDIWRIISREKAIDHHKQRATAERQAVIIPIRNARVDDNFSKKIQEGWQKINSLHDDKSSYLHIDVEQKKVFARGLPNQMEELKMYIREIDEPVVQIRIDAILVIAEKNFNFNFGFDWSGIYNRQQTVAQNGSPFAFYGLGGTELDFPTPNMPVANPPNRQMSTNIFVNPLDFALNLFNSGANFLTGNVQDTSVPGAIRLPFIFGGPNLSWARLNIVLNAAEIDAKLKIVTRPSVLTSNNEIAKLLIGKSIPLQTTIEDLSTNSTRNITTINFKDVGTMIEVKPTVTPDKKSIFLDILIEDSAVTSGSTKTNQQGILVDPPTVSVVKVKNRVQLRNGQTTIIGGLSYQLNQESRNMVPWFWKIPILGYFFQASFTNNQDRERYIFLTPTIIEEET